MNYNILKNLKKDRKELSWLTANRPAKKKSAFYNHNDYSAQHEQLKNNHTTPKTNPKSE